MRAVQPSIAFVLVVLLIALAEFAWRKRSGRGYSLGSLGANLGVMAGQLVSKLVSGGVVTAAMFAVFAVFAYAPVQWAMDDWRTWAVGFFVLEFFYYWQHRFSHTIRWLWTSHAVHHSPNEFTLPAAFRLGWTGTISGGWVLLLPMALMGFHPVVIATLMAINLRYQYFLHTEAVGKLGPLEWVFNTPSHHRVHHGSNPAYLDTNFGGVLIVFDRLFGTFVEERDDEPVRYGLTKPVTSNNPFVIAFHEWANLWRDLKNMRSMRSAWRVLFGRPSDLDTSNPSDPARQALALNEPSQIHIWRLRMTSTIRAWSLLCMVAAVSLSACSGEEMEMSAPPPTSESGVTLLSDVQYGNGATRRGSVELLLDIYQPSATCTAPRPTVFYVHGGAFILGDKADEIVAALAPRVAAEGLNFVSINYRLSGDRPVFSEEYAAFAQSLVDDGLADPDGAIFDALISAIEDGVTALRWMEQNADTFCFDMSRLGYWGSSAGTIITAQIAYALNPFSIARPEPRFVNAWWGQLFRIEDLEAGEAPFLILHGNGDPLVPYQVSVDLAAQAERVGVPFAFYTLVGAGHGFDLDNPPQTAAAVQVSIDFAVDQLTGGTPVYGRFDLP